jgi:hypothetical protein
MRLLAINVDLLGGLCDPAGIRTQDPNIKSVMLYQLSYGIFLLTSSIVLPFPFKVVQI